MNSYFILFRILPSFSHMNSYLNRPTMNSYVLIGTCVTEAPAITTAATTYPASTEAAAVVGIDLRKSSPSVELDYDHDHNNKSTTCLQPSPMIESQTDNRIVASVKNLLRLTSDMNSWSSKFMVTHGNTVIDVSSAAQSLPSAPYGICPPQTISSSKKSCYYFDENLFFGIDASESLLKMLQSPHCVDRCKLVCHRSCKKVTYIRKRSWTYVCSHGKVMNDMKESHFKSDSVEKSNVPIQRLKLTKSKGSAVRGELLLL